MIVLENIAECKDRMQDNVQVYWTLKEESVRLKQKFMVHG